MVITTFSDEQLGTLACGTEAVTAEVAHAILKYRGHRAQHHECVNRLQKQVSEEERMVRHLDKVLAQLEAFLSYRVKA